MGILLDYWHSFLLFTIGNISFFAEKNYSNLTDEQIIEKIQNGDDNLYEELVNRYSDKIFRYIYYHFNFSKDLSQELVQEVFLKVWLNLKKFDKNTNFSAWIYRLTHNLIIDHLRKEKLKLTDCDISDLNLGKNFEADNGKYKQLLLKQILEKLDDKYKDVLILYYFENKSYDDIAKIYGISKGTIGSLIKRAKDKLKEIIKNDDLLKDALEI